MSTIIIVKKNGCAAIASDTCSSQGDTNCLGHYKANSNKIHVFEGNYIGISGSATHHDVFESLIKKHRQLISLKSRKDIFETYLNLHRYLKQDYYVLTEEDDKDQPYESSQITALIANAHGIFEMFSYREVTEYTRFWAIGSGAEFALGSLFALYDRMEDAEQIALEAVRAAAEFDNATALPGTSYSVKLKTPGARQKAKG